jgi:hypothetical protein
MADAAQTTGGYQPTAEELVQAAKDAKTQNPDFGVKRVWTLLKEKGWVVSEQRVKKVMQENGLSENTSANTNGTANGSDKDKNNQSATASVRDFNPNISFVDNVRDSQDAAPQEKKKGKSGILDRP